MISSSVLPSSSALDEIAAFSFVTSSIDQWKSKAEKGYKERRGQDCQLPRKHSPPADARRSIWLENCPKNTEHTLIIRGTANKSRKFIKLLTDDCHYLDKCCNTRRSSWEIIRLQWMNPSLCWQKNHQYSPCPIQPRSRYWLFTFALIHQTRLRPTRLHFTVATQFTHRQHGVCRSGSRSSVARQRWPCKRPSRGKRSRQNTRSVNRKRHQ